MNDQNTVITGIKQSFWKRLAGATQSPSMKIFFLSLFCIMSWTSVAQSDTRKKKKSLRHKRRVLIYSPIVPESKPEIKIYRKTPSKVTDAPLLQVKVGKNSSPDMIKPQETEPRQLKSTDPIIDSAPKLESN